MSLSNIPTATPSAADPSSQGIRARDVKSQISPNISRLQRPSSPKPLSGAHASHGLLSQRASSQNVTRLSPPIGQFIINTLLQIAGFVAAIAFGIYAVQSVTVSKDANSSADTANQLALLGLCLQSNGSAAAIESVCSRVIYYAGTTLSDIASTLFPGLPSSIPSTTSGGSTTSTPTPSPTSSSAPKQSQGSSGTLIAIVVGVLVFILSVGLTLYFCVRRRRSKRYGPVSPNGTVPTEKKQQLGKARSVMQDFSRLFVETRVITEPQ